MELYPIGKERLEIFLTPEDMNEYNISGERFDYKNTETRRAVWTILDTAKKETGFDAASGKIRIDALPSKSGGCVIFITKTDTSENTEAPMSVSNENFPAARERSCLCIYGFKALEPLLSACHFLSLRGYTGESAVFYEKGASDENKYYLIILDKIAYRGREKHSVFENMFVGEFGVRIHDENAFLYIKEHCECICDKAAVGVLAELA